VALEVAQLPGGREEVCSKFDESLGGVQDCSGRAASGLLVVDYPWRCSACDRGDVDVGQCRRRPNVVGEPKPLLRLHLRSGFPLHPLHGVACYGRESNSTHR